MNGNFLRKTEEVNPKLTQYFKDNGFEVSWDSDRYYEWIEIYENRKLIMQIESNITVEQFIDLLLRDYDARKKGVFIDPGFFVASDVFNDDEKCLEFCNRFELFKNKIQ